MEIPAPELVQLLTPEGERVHHPDYDVDLADDELPRASTATWCSSAASTPRPPRCSGRASSASGRRCSARRPPRSGPAGRCARRLRLPDLPRARRRLVPAASTRSSCSALFRGVTNGGWDPHEQQLRALHDRHRQPEPCTPSATPWACQRDGARRRRSSPTSATARPARATSTRRSSSPSVVQRARRVLLPEQPVGDLRAAGEADPHPAVPARGRLRLPRRPGRRQRRARRPRGHPQAPRRRARGPGPDA